MGVAITTYPETLRRRAGVFALLLFACASMWAFAASPARAAQVVNNATCDYETQQNVAMPQEGASASLTVTNPVIKVVISATDVVWAGNNIEYTINVSNPGSDPLSARDAEEPASSRHGFRQRGLYKALTPPAP